MPRLAAASSAASKVMVPVFWSAAVVALRVFVDVGQQVQRPLTRGLQGRAVLEPLAVEGHHDVAVGLLTCLYC